jgi:hypothetical protein
MEMTGEGLLLGAGTISRQKWRGMDAVRNYSRLTMSRAS